MLALHARLVADDRLEGLRLRAEQNAQQVVDARLMEHLVHGRHLQMRAQQAPRQRISLVERVGGRVGLARGDRRLVFAPGLVHEARGIEALEDEVAVARPLAAQLRLLRGDLARGKALRDLLFRIGLVEPRHRPAVGGEGAAAVDLHGAQVDGRGGNHGALPEGAPPDGRRRQVHWKGHSCGNLILV
jgi:hypothetical protein